MREFRTSGSVGAPGEQFPGATRLRKIYIPFAYDCHTQIEKVIDELGYDYPSGPFRAYHIKDKNGLTVYPSGDSYLMWP